MNRALYFCCFFLALSLASAEIKNRGWWKHAVFYQVYPRSFMDSDNDGIGDLKGIRSKMEHFKECGVEGIWLSPIYESPMIDMGYDISNFTAIHPSFGTMKDFEDLVARAKQLGIKVILDFVPNHTSSKHPWFQKALAGDEKYKNYYVWRSGKNNDDKTPPNNWIRLFEGSAWKYCAKWNQWYLHQFTSDQPDLNYSNPEVREEMEKVILFWLNKGIDGFRIDAMSFIFEDDRFLDEPPSNDPRYTSNDYESLDHIYTKDDIRDYELIARWRKVVDDFAAANNQDEKVLMTEPLSDIVPTTKYYKYGSNMPFNFEWILHADSNSNASLYKHIIDSWMENVPYNASANWVLGNHDRPRLATRYGNRTDQMLMLEMILPGVAVTYYGEEIGMSDNLDITFEESVDQLAFAAGKEKYLTRSRDPCRTPFQWNDQVNAGFSKANHTWLPVNKNYKILNLAREKDDINSPYNLYRNLTSLRRSSKALKDGKLKTQVLKIHGAEVLLVAREIFGESIVLLINFSNSKTVKVNLKRHVRIHAKTVVFATNLAIPNLRPGAKVNPHHVKLTPTSSLLIRSSLR